MENRSFFSRLTARAVAVESLLCVGLDPHPADLPAASADAAETFCLQLIESTAAYAAAFKPNSAFFEMYGPPGMAALQKVIAAVPDGIPVILDGKRGDIPSTAQAYAQAAFHAFGADALTANPYLGREALEPFISNASYGVFLLCKTSNPGAADLQDLRVANLPDPLPPEAGLALYEVVARLALELNRNDNLGLVVGATQPQALARVRAIAPQMWILAPGVGAQGGDLQAAMQAGLDADGFGLLLPVSRGLTKASDTRQAARVLRDTINAGRAAVSGPRAASTAPAVGAGIVEPDLTGPKASLADDLLQAGCIKFGQFTLKSGLISPIYIDLRELGGHPRLLSKAAAAYMPILQELSFDRLAALPYAALPIATAISLQSGWPMVYTRKENKPYGAQADVVGGYASGERVVVIDDLATTGGSKFEAIEKLLQAGLKVAEVVVLIDRQSGAAQALKQAGYRLRSVYTLTQLLDYWEASGQVNNQQVSAVRDFLQHHG